MANEVEDSFEKTKDWRIPRPSLYTSSSETDSSISTTNYENNIRTVYSLDMMPPGKSDDLRIDMTGEEAWFSSCSSTSSESSSSSNSASSGSLLLTASNLNRLKPENILSNKPLDSQSIASSTHFTLVNGVTINKKPLPECCWRNHQLAVLVISMTIILFLGILAAVLFIEIRATELHYP